MRSVLELWLMHPITKSFRKMISEQRAAHIDRMLNCGVITPDKLPELAQLKGQINALDLLLDDAQLEIYLDDEVDTDEKIPTTSGQSDN